MPPLIPALKERVALIQKSVTGNLRHWWQWLTLPRDPIDWKSLRTRARLPPKSSVATEHLWFSL